jgi:hypothetical protein
MILNKVFWNIPPIQYVTKLLYPILNSNYVIGDLNGHSFMATKISFMVALPLRIHFTLVLIFIHLTSSPPIVSTLPMLLSNVL